MRWLLIVLALAACGIDGAPEPVEDEDPKVSGF